MELRLKKAEVVAEILKAKLNQLPTREKGIAFAPTNIALCKYWGKRDLELNLPMTNSLSVTLPDRGAMTTLTLRQESSDQIILNKKVLTPDSVFVRRTVDYLNLFRPKQNWFLNIDISMNIPVAAGLASSACGFASLIMALNDLFVWELSLRDLSILARLGSGSAARSLWRGLVEWHAGTQFDGMDCYATPIATEWTDLYVGLLIMSNNEKPISSREAMQRTVDTSILYQSWPKKVAQDLKVMKNAIQNKNFALLAGTAESNALSMHATMLSSWPPICYWTAETLSMIHKIWDLRQQGMSVYFTEDAGPNLKLLFLERNKTTLLSSFPTMEAIKIFD